MKTIGDCLAISSKISDADRDSLLDRVDSNIAAGMPAREAQTSAVSDMLAEIAAESREVRSLVRQQHADLFVKPKEAPRSQFFTNPDEFDAKPKMSRQPSVAQTRTEEFKRWFGEGNTMANADGSPMVLYHGTTKQNAKAIQAFKRSKYGAMGPAIYLGDSKEASAGYDQGAMMKVYARGKYLTNMQWTAYIGKHGWGGAEAAAKADGWAGVYDAMFESAVAVWDASNIKSATDNAGTFDESDNIRMARNTTGGFTLRAFGRGAQFIEAIQDRYNRWKQVIADIKKQGGLVTEANDFYRAEERYWGKVGSRIEDFQVELQQFIKDVAKDKLTLKDVQTYAYARHAKERNAYLKGVRGTSASGFDSWSGMSDADAQAYIDDAQQAGLEPALEKHRAKLQEWIAGTRAIMLDEGLITDDEFLRLSSMFADYVPLRGLKEDDGTTKQGRQGTGSGFNVRGKETQRAKGRFSEADNIIEYIIQDRTRTLIRAGKNEVLRSFLQFVVDNPSSNLWEINAVERRPVLTVDDNGNQVIEEINAVVKDDTTVGIKDGGREVYVRIKDKPLLEQMKNMNVDGVGKLTGMMLMAQRALGRMYTSLNPVFTVINWARDVQTATMGMLDETGFKGAAKVWLNLPKAIWDSYGAEFGKPGADYQLYRATGGKTGFFDFRDIDTLSKDLQADLVNAERSGLDPRVWGPAALRLVEKLNGGIENATRLAAFNAARSEGKTLAEAASISKNITVNFNRKGTWTPQLAAFFLFFNPAVQGTTRIAQALKSPKVLAVLGSGMTGVALLALQNASMGDDDDGVAWWDKIPSETKDRNLIIVLPPGASGGEAVPGSKVGRYIKIPMPYGWNFFATTANQAVDAYRHGLDPARGRGTGEAAAKMASSFLGAYMPVQELSRSLENSKSAVLAAVPDFLNPIAQPLLNVSGFGKPMYPEAQFGGETPDSAKYFVGQAGTIFQRTAEGLNAATGGNRYKSGLLDFTPATLENLARSYGGGPASFTLDLMNAMYARQSIERPDLDVRRLPFVKQMYGQIDAETDRMVAYDRLQKISDAVDPILRAEREGAGPEVKQLIKDAGALAYLGDAAKTTRESLSTIRKQELAIISSSDLESVKYARLRALDEQKRKVMQGLNRVYDQAIRAKPAPTAP